MNYLTRHEGGGGVDFQSPFPQAGNLPLEKDLTEKGALLAKTEPPQASRTADALSLSAYVGAEAPSLPTNHHSSTHRPSHRSSTAITEEPWRRSLPEYRTYDDLRSLVNFVPQSYREAWELVDSFQNIVRDPTRKIPSDLAALTAHIIRTTLSGPLTSIERFSLIIAFYTCWNIAISSTYLDSEFIQVIQNDLLTLKKNLAQYVVTFQLIKKNAIDHLLSSYFLYFGRAWFSQTQFTRLVDILTSLDQRACTAKLSEFTRMQLREIFTTHPLPPSDPHHRFDKTIILRFWEYLRKFGGVRLADPFATLVINAGYLPPSSLPSSHSSSTSSTTTTQPPITKPTASVTPLPTPPPPPSPLFTSHPPTSSRPTLAQTIVPELRYLLPILKSSDNLSSNWVNLDAAKTNADLEEYLTDTPKTPQEWLEIIYTFNRLEGQKTERDPIIPDKCFEQLLSTIRNSSLNPADRVHLLFTASTSFRLGPNLISYIESEFKTSRIERIHTKHGSINVIEYVLVSYFSRYTGWNIESVLLSQLVLLIEKLINLGCPAAISPSIANCFQICHDTYFKNSLVSSYKSNTIIKTHLTKLVALLRKAGVKELGFTPFSPLFSPISGSSSSSSSSMALAKPTITTPTAPPPLTTITPTSALMRSPEILIGVNSSGGSTFEFQRFWKTLSSQEKDIVKKNIQTCVAEIEKAWTQPHIQQGLKVLLRQSNGAKIFNLALHPISDSAFFKELLKPLNDFHAQHIISKKTTGQLLHYYYFTILSLFSGLRLDADEKTVQSYLDLFSKLHPDEAFNKNLKILCSKKTAMHPFPFSLSGTVGFEGPLCHTLFSLMLKELQIYAQHLPVLDKLSTPKCTTRDACFLYYRDEKFEVYPLQLQIYEDYPSLNAIGLDGDHAVSRKLQAHIPALRSQSSTSRGFSLTIEESKQLLDYYQANQANFYLLTAPKETGTPRAALSARLQSKESEDADKNTTESSSKKSVKQKTKEKEVSSSESSFNPSDFPADYEEEEEASGVVPLVEAQKAEFAVPRAALTSSIQLVASVTNPFDEAMRDICLGAVKKIDRHLSRHRSKETDREIFTHTKPLTELLAIPSTQEEEIQFEDSLKRYQKEGVSWMLTLSQKKLGGILASAPGLGKTRQAIECIRQLQRKDSAGNPVVVVVPNSIAAQWKEEVLKILFSHRKTAVEELIRTCTQEGLKQLGDALYLLVTAQEREISQKTAFLETVQRRQNELYELALQASATIPQLPFDMIKQAKTSSEIHFWLALILSNQEAHRKLTEDKVLEKALNNIRYHSFKEAVKEALAKKLTGTALKCALDNAVQKCTALSSPVGQNAVKAVAEPLKGAPKPLPKGAPSNAYDSLVTIDMYSQVIACTSETPKKVLDTLTSPVKWRIIIVSDTSLNNSGQDDPQSIRARISQLPLNAVFWDEAHTKTWKMDTTTKILASSALDFLTKMQKKGAHRMLLTGTPFINDYRETVSLVQLANPHLDLSAFVQSLVRKEHEFKKQLTRYLKKPEFLEKQEFLKECTQSFFNLFTAYEHLRIIFKRLFCVHENADASIQEDWTKDDKLHIPTKKSTELTFTLTAEQRVNLDTILKKKKINPMIQKVAENILFHPEFQKPEWKLKGKEVYTKVASWTDTQIAKFIQASGFLTTFLSDDKANPLVGAIRAGESFVIVVPQIKHGCTLMAIIQKRYPNTKILFFSGNETLAERDAIVKSFEESAARETTPGCSTIVILSLKAGGVGLNLKAGRRLFNLAPWWNDAVTDQVEARIVRAGSSGDRDMYKYNSKHAVQHHLDKVVQLKRKQKDYFFSKNGEYSESTAIDVMKRQIKLLLDYFQIECQTSPENPLDHEFTLLLEKMNEVLEESGDEILSRLKEATTFTMSRHTPVPARLPSPSPSSSSSSSSETASPPTTTTPKKEKRPIPTQVKAPVGTPVPALLPSPSPSSSSSSRTAPPPTGTPSKKEVTPIPHSVPQTLVIPIGTSKDTLSAVPTVRPHTREEAIILFSRLQMKEQSQRGFIAKFLGELKQLSKESSTWVELWNTPASQKRLSGLSDWCTLQESMSSAPSSYNVEVYELKENRLVKDDRESRKDAHITKNCRLLKRINGQGALCYELLIK